MEEENDGYTYLYFVAREIDLTDGSQTYTLVGVVNGNPKGCRAERDFPDYHTSIGNAEVCKMHSFYNIVVVAIKFSIVSSRQRFKFIVTI